MRVVITSLQKFKWPLPELTIGYFKSGTISAFGILVEKLSNLRYQTGISCEFPPIWLESKKLAGRSATLSVGVCLISLTRARGSLQRCDEILQIRQFFYKNTTFIQRSWWITTKIVSLWTVSALFAWDRQFEKEFVEWTILILIVDFDT